MQLLEQKHEMVLTSRKGLKSLSGNEYSEYLYKEIESSKSLVELYSQKVASSEAKLRAYVDSASSLSQEIGALDVQVNSSRSEFLNIDSIRTKKREELSRLNEKSRQVYDVFVKPTPLANLHVCQRYLEKGECRKY